MAELERKDKDSCWVAGLLLAQAAILAELDSSEEWGGPSEDRPKNRVKLLRAYLT